MLKRMVLAAVFVIGLWAAPAAAQQYPPTNSSVPPATQAAPEQAAPVVENPSSGQLPRTGDDTMPLVRLGLGLAAVGGVITAIAAERRRRAAAG